MLRFDWLPLTTIPLCVIHEAQYRYVSDIHYEDLPSFILFVKYHQYIIKYIPKPDMVVQDCNLIAWEVEAGVQYGPEQPELYSEFQSILGCGV